MTIENFVIDTIIIICMSLKEKQQQQTLGATHVNYQHPQPLFPLTDTVHDIISRIHYPDLWLQKLLQVNILY